MAAILGPGGPSMATQFAVDSPGGPVMAGHQLWRGTNCGVTAPNFHSRKFFQKGLIFSEVNFRNNKFVIP